MFSDTGVQQHEERLISAVERSGAALRSTWETGLYQSNKKKGKKRHGLQLQARSQSAALNNAAADGRRKAGGGGNSKYDKHICGVLDLLFSIKHIWIFFHLDLPFKTALKNLEIMQKSS